MSISFNSLPNTLRVPLFYAEFDSSKAKSGPVVMNYRTLLMGQKTSGGTATANLPVRFTSVAEAKALFGAGSMLHRMAAALFANNNFGEFWAIPLADNGSGVAATGTATVTGPATAAGTISLYIGGQKIEVAVSSGDAYDDIADAIAAAVAADTDLAVTAAAAAGVVTFTAKNKGTLGNDIDLRLNYYDGEALPAGVGVALVAMASGATDPTITSAIAAMGETQYHVIGFPYATSLLDTLETELDDRFGPIRMNDGIAVSFKSGSHSTITTFGNTRNSKHVTMAGMYKSPTPSFEWTGALAGIVAKYGPIDPARPFQTLSVEGCLAPKPSDRFTINERNLLLYDGISSLNVDESGKVHIDRLITTYQRNTLGVDDTSYLDLNPRLTLSYLRFDFRAMITTKYPRHKLGNDDTRYGSGQPIMTPKLMKAECVAKFRQWEELGLVEDVDQFINDLIVERNIQDPNRLDVMLPPNLMNQLVIVGVQIGFLL